MKRVLTSIMVLAILIGVGVAYAGATRFGSLVNVLEITEQDGCASGMAVMNYAADEEVTQIQVNCQDLTPSGIYEVYMHLHGDDLSFPEDYTWVGTAIARPNGKLTVHGWLADDVVQYPWIVGVYRVSDIAEGYDPPIIGILSGVFPNPNP